MKEVIHDSSSSTLETPLYFSLLAKSREFIHQQLDIPTGFDPFLDIDPEIELSQEELLHRARIINATGRLVIGLYNEMHKDFHSLHGSEYEKMSKIEQSRNRVSMAVCTFENDTIHSYFQTQINNSAQSSDDEVFLFEEYHHQEVVNG